MNSITIRDEYGNEFPVDATARPFWEKRPGCRILDDSPAPEGDTSPAAGAAPIEPDDSGAKSEPPRGSKKG
ncbi:hypothetical protein ABZ897_00885 [Nonomuraea sp. NPDC046802]|uniref:hypothetical protein n=1 Tax=Nonomuraea sp. NPDC046802 TaxID=3154919 RepID=UPI0033E4D4E4